MEAGTRAVLVIAAIFLGAIVWLEIYSRRQAAKKELAGSNEKAEQAPEAEAPDWQKIRKKEIKVVSDKGLLFPGRLGR